MITSIIFFAIELITTFVTNAMLQNQTQPMEFGTATFIIFIYATCLIGAVISLIYCIAKLRNWLLKGKAKYIVGIVFSSVTILYGLIFFISFFIGLGAAA